MKNPHRMFFLPLNLFLFFLFGALSCPAFAEQAAEVTTNEAVTAAPSQDVAAAPAIPSEELVRQAWAASSQIKEEELNRLVIACLATYEKKAREEQAKLSGFPDRGTEDDYRALNDVGTILFVQAEFLMNQGRTEDAVKAFEYVIQNYPSAQAWDPSRGSFWSVKEKSQASIDVMTGKAEDEEQKVQPERIRTKPHLAFPGKEQVVDYRKYGKFVGVGTQDYQYELSDPKGLSEAVGEGIHPNTTVLRDPNYKKVKAEGRLEGSHWDFVHSDDLEAAFYKWALAAEPSGVKLFYLALILERAGMYYEAIKAYHALVVHFPKTTAKTYWQTPWYPAQAAIAKIKHIIRVHPELNLTAKWMKIEVRNGFDNDVNNDVIITFPGVIQKKNWWDCFRDQYFPGTKKVDLRRVKRTLGKGTVQLVQYENGHWQLMVQGKPYVIKGMTYAPTKVGQSPDKGTLKFWMDEDTDNNGRLDGPYDAWVDKNRNNQQDADEPTVGDFQLMKEMGVNTLRIYYQPFKPKKEVMRAMFEKFGIRVAMGNFLGKYTLGSGATWLEGTDYTNPIHQKNMMASILEMVTEYKDEPYILLWILGNENNYGVSSNADKNPEAYYKFVNEVAKMIKTVDPNHPVAICNGDTLFLDIFARYAPDVDIYAGNVYRGDYGFGSFWEQVFDATGKAAFITEYGAPAYAAHSTMEEAEQAQADYHRGNWEDIADNLAGRKDGVGNALGGFIFEWLDEWWKNYEPFRHDRKSDAIGPFPGGFYYEEWFGMAGQGNGTHSPFLRQLRKVYFTYQEMWKGL